MRVTVIGRRGRVCFLEVRTDFVKSLSFLLQQSTETIQKRVGGDAGPWTLDKSPCAWRFLQAVGNIDDFVDQAKKADSNKPSGAVKAAPRTGAPSSTANSPPHASNPGVVHSELNPASPPFVPAGSGILGSAQAGNSPRISPRGAQAANSPRNSPHGAQAANSPHNNPRSGQNTDPQTTLLGSSQMSGPICAPAYGCHEWDCFEVTNDPTLKDCAVHGRGRLNRPVSLIQDPPDARYYACYYYREGGCQYISITHDAHCPHHTNQLLCDNVTKINCKAGEGVPDVSIPADDQSNAEDSLLFAVADDLQVFPSNFTQSMTLVKRMGVDLSEVVSMSHDVTEEELLEIVKASFLEKSVLNLVFGEVLKEL